MKIILMSMMIMIQCTAMRSRYNPSDLFRAVNAQNEEKVLYILLSALDTKQPVEAMLEWQNFPQRRTALLQAFEHNNCPIAQMLVNAGANVFSSDFSGKSPFCWSYTYQKIDLLKICLSTRKLLYKRRMERILINDLLKAQATFTPDQITDLFQTALARSIEPDWRRTWLQQLADASLKASLVTEERAGFARVAPLYKAVAPLLVAYYHDRRAQLVAEIAIEGKRNYLNIIPAELREYALDFFLQGSAKSHQQNLRLIQAMPEH